MKTKLLISVALALGLLLSCVPTFAHHGTAAYDMSKPVVLKDAVVTKYAWINPHTLITFDHKDESGNVQHWTVEIGSPAAVSLVGWSRNSLKAGDVITIYVWQTKTGRPVGRLNKIMLADGSVLRDTQTGGDDGGRADNGAR
jgi:Family of unknown function (DUF6152)